MHQKMIFTDDYLIGIPEIDKQHKHLFELIAEVDQSLEDNADPNVIASRMLYELKEYARYHFSTEEAYMERIHDPELEMQKKAHASFIQKVESTDLSNLSDEATREAVMELQDFLAHWLLNHILSSDTLIGGSTRNPLPEQVVEEAVDEDPYAFTEKYHTGIEFVDKEHEKLFEIMRHIDFLIHQEHYLYDLYDELVETLKELEEYTKFHFRDEENYMRSIGYDGLDAQVLAHEGFVDRIEGIDLADADEHQKEYLEDLLGFLLNWLSAHILNMDKRIPVK
ncbi:MAG: bacteriohemerythrin [Lachnospiraceae bacterium]|nr:bacteriohemerythrin [Lachnospiraceae bacterium]